MSSKFRYYEKVIFIWQSPALSSQRVYRPVGFVQLYHLFFQFLCLCGGKLEVTEVMAGMLFWVIVSKFSLQCVRSQQGMSHKRARQAARGNVLPELKAQVVSAERGREKGQGEQLVMTGPLIILEFYNIGTLHSPGKKIALRNKKPILILGLITLQLYL